MLSLLSLPFIHVSKFAALRFARNAAAQLQSEGNESRVSSSRGVAR